VNSQLSGFADLQYRLLKLETQNRRLKRLGAAALIVVTLLVVMGEITSKAKHPLERAPRPDRGLSYRLSHLTRFLKSVNPSLVLLGHKMNILL
jgi:hypothetical protein